MTDEQEAVITAWSGLILLTIQCEDADAAYRVTRATVQRLRQIGALRSEERAALIQAGMTAAIRVA